MKFSLTFDCGNAAFDNGDLHWEIARILHDCAHRVNNGGFEPDSSFVIWDNNGNTIGTMTLTEED